jgi:hypothetical protein
MRARTRNTLTLAALVYIATVGYLFTVLALRTFNVLLATVVVPLLWLVWAFARWSAYQHSARWARDIKKVHSGRPVRAVRR